VVMVDHAAPLERAEDVGVEYARPERNGDPQLLTEDLGPARAARSFGSRYRGSGPVGS